MILAVAKKIVSCRLADISFEGLICRKNTRRVKHAEQLLSKDEVLRIIKASDSTKVAAAIAVCWDGALRVSELLNLRLEDIRQDEYGFVITVRGKTGERPVRLTASCGYLAAWLRHRGDGPGRLFPHSKQWMGNHLRGATKRAGIKKRVFPHLLRHSRLTDLSKVLSRQALVYFAGWSEETRMDQVYVHLSESDIDTAILRVAGIVKDADKSLVRCPRCHFLTYSSETYCSNCGALLKITQDDFNKLEVEQLMFRVLQDPEIQRSVVQKMKEILEKESQK